MNKLHYFLPEKKKTKKQKPSVHQLQVFLQ